MFIECLNLDGLENTLYFKNFNISLTEEEDGKEYSAKTVFLDPINNNRIEFESYNINVLKHRQDVEISNICNGMRFSPFSYLMNELNNNKNLVVRLSKVEYTTSDYCIFYDDKEITDNTEASFKYTQVKNGIVSKLEV